MTLAIFHMILYLSDVVFRVINYCRLIFMIVVVHGEKSILLEEPIVKMKEIFTYVGQLFTCSVCVIVAVKNLEQPPKRIKDMLNHLSIISQCVEEFKRSTTRFGGNIVLACAKAYLPELDLAAVEGGFPEYKIDTSYFLDEYFVN